MRCLFIFCDMLRPNMLHTHNHKIKDKKLMDLWFEDIGGTIYTNCYTPAPDTPRSMACFYTGLYSKKNGCDHRLKWPQFFIDENKSTIFDLFKSKKFDMSVYIDYHKFKAGFIPAKNIDDLNIFHDLNLFLYNLEHKIKSNKNIFSFITLNDYHYAINDYGNNKFGEMKAQKKLSDMFDIIFNTIDKKDFDYIIIFSDHGFKLHSEIDKKSNLSLLNEDRTKIMLQIYEKGNKNIKYKHDLKTIMDIFPMFNDILQTSKSKQSKTDGVSLLHKSDKDRFVVFEDYTTFTSDINSRHGIWGFKDNNNNFYYTDLYNGISNMNVIDQEKAIKKIKIKSSSFSDSLKLKLIRDSYNEMDEIYHPKKYSDDSDRLINKFTRKMLRVIGRNL